MVTLFDVAAFCPDQGCDPERRLVRIKILLIAAWARVLFMFPAEIFRRVRKLEDRKYEFQLIDGVLLT